MKHLRFWVPFLRKLMNSGPSEPMLLTSPVKCPPPTPSHPFAKYIQALQIPIWCRRRSIRTAAI
jgi:hypothetical protein